jgi:hypothetical protein
MFVTCLCPTYLRPECVAQTIVLFERQTYPPERRFLLVFDDAGQLRPKRGDRWAIVSVPQRYPSLPEKYGAMLELCPDITEAIVVWDDDDLYLSRHIEASVAALQDAGWAHPRYVYSVYAGRLQVERSDGRFHAALAMRWETCLSVGGWPATRRADFDQQLLAKLQAQFGPAGDSSRLWGPTYVHWFSNGLWHSQLFMRSPDDEEWYDRIAKATYRRNIDITPALIPEAARLLKKLDRSHF